MAAGSRRGSRSCEDEGGERDPGEEGAAVAMVEVVASFEFVGLGGAETVGVKEDGHRAAGRRRRASRRRGPWRRCVRAEDGCGWRGR